ncbi:MAG TPA: hypothetical protein VNO30_34275 [Kofleriaceae bacterium]|nr:hypothetical protein [Kofleriaceae bacterium]
MRVPLIAILAAACTPRPPEPRPAVAPALPAWLSGTWKREWIRRDGVTTNTLTVRYLQTPRWFGDVRIPADRPRITAGSLAELSDAELAALAKQRGFFGYTTVAGDVATWHHELDYQPKSGGADTGRIERLGASSMLEHGLDGSFVEHWWSLASGDGKFLTVRVTRAGRLDRMLVVAGDHFLYARNRARDLPAAGSLTELAAQASREQLLAYLDCELSYGSVRGGSVPWQIERSTLPWREGAPLPFVDDLTVDAAGALATPAAAGADETWTIPLDTLPPDDRRVLFPLRAR